MSQALDDVPATARPTGIVAEPVAVPVRLSRRIRPSAVGTLFAMTVGRLCRAQRLLVLVLLYLLPIGLVVIVRQFGSDSPRHLEMVVLLNLLPYTLIPLTALLTAPGLIRDEVEEQTLTYLLVRPLPRWLIYVAKLTATIVVTAALAAVFATATEATIWWGHEDFARIVPERAAKLSALFALALVGYNAVFGALGLFVRRPLVIGVLYMIVLEGILANIDFVFRRGTVMYYFRVLVLRWLEPDDPGGWSIDLDMAPGAIECVTTLLTASLVLTALAAFTFTVREFRVKTPEAS